jgi:hypothetical protein
VREKREGRQRIYQLEPDRIREIAKWAEQYRVFWQHNITSLKRHLEKFPERKS